MASPLIVLFTDAVIAFTDGVFSATEGKGGSLWIQDSS
jgi:hypothetical protein